MGQGCCGGARQVSAVPTEIGRANEHDLKVTWQDGHASIYPARALRLSCPCAACVDEVTGQVRVIATAIAQNVRPLKVELVGRYALAIHWSDGHNTGIYAFEKLRALCPCCGAASSGRPSAVGGQQSTDRRPLIADSHGCGGGGCGCR